MNNKGICIRSKTYCKVCDRNQDGWCTWVDKSVDEIYQQWEKRRKKKMYTKKYIPPPI